MNVFSRIIMIVFFCGIPAISCSDSFESPSSEKKNESSMLLINSENIKYKERPDSTWKNASIRVLNSDCDVSFPPLNAWGGRTDKTAETKCGKDGFFRIGHMGKRLVFIDPENGVNIIHGTQNVCPSNSEAFKSQFESNVVWASQTNDFLKNANINCIDYGGVRPCKFPDEIYNILINPSNEYKMAYNVQLSALRSYMWDKSRFLDWEYEDNNGIHNRLNLIFEPGYEKYLDQEMQRICAFFTEDKHLIGYQLDNELGFRGWDDRSGSQGILLNKFLQLPKKAAARKYAEAFVEEFHLNKTDIASVSRKSEIINKGLSEAFDTFRYRVARKYYQMYHDAIKKYDNNHLIMGSRLHSFGMYDKQTLEACAEYCDVITINYYGAITPSLKYMQDIKNWTNNTPFFISEFYVKGEDAAYNGILYNNLTGGGWIVPTQTDRGLYYQNFCIGLLEAQNCVGWTHFAYTDVYVSTSENNGNRGLVNCDFHPYKEFVNKVSLLNKYVYVLADLFDSHE